MSASTGQSAPAGLRPRDAAQAASGGLALEAAGLGKAFFTPRARHSEDPRRERAGWRRDRFWALRDVKFSVSRGQALGIVGHNGSGKSTLLKILAGVMTADAGRFAAHGRVGALLELGAGFHPDLTGVENVYLNGSLLGLTVQEVDRLLPEIIAFAELERFMDMPVRHYSSGMNARLGFAVATRLAPEILMMDETFATGDARFQARALEHVAGMKQRGHTLLLVSHSLELMTELADRVLWLDRGVVRALGATRDVLSEYRRSQHALFAGVEQGRGMGGLDVMFRPVAEPPGPLRIASAALRALDGAGRPAPPGGEGRIEIPREGRLALRVRIEHAPAAPPQKPGVDPAPSRVIVETAWLRLGDHRLLAQSIHEFALDAAGVAEHEIEFTAPPLLAAEWRLAVAARFHDAATPPAGRSPREVEYCDRVELPEIVVTQKPHPEIPALSALGGGWTAE